MINIQLGDTTTIDGTIYTLQAWHGSRGMLTGSPETASGKQVVEVLEVDQRTGAVSRYGTLIGRIVGSNFHHA